MSRISLCLVSIALVVVAFGCRDASTRPSHETLRPLLNSERIERIFGSYGIEVLESDPIRVSNLYSLERGQPVCRTLAIIRFSESIPDALSGPYRTILQGSSLGATLKEAGWTVEKKHEYFGEIAMGDRFRELAHLSANPNGTRYALHIYALWAVKADERYPFSIIAEIHHPQYLKLADLTAIYATELAGNLKADRDDLELIALVHLVSEN